VVLIVAVAGTIGFVYSGMYNIGADDPHSKPVLALMHTLRERSIEARAQDITVPDLADPQLLLKGAGQYAAMCTGCHLKPGMKESELRAGLYPRPPDLTRFKPDPREAFWVIKHGIKMSAMPAWGFTHDDATIWSMVAFLQKMPAMTPGQYQDIVSRAPPDEDMDMGDAAVGHALPAEAAPAASALPAPAMSTSLARPASSGSVGTE
jgi:mono/diheme cytochrome c family protein